MVGQEGSHSPSGRLMAQRSGPPARSPVLGWSVHTERGDWPVTPSSHGQRLAILSLCTCGCRVGNPGCAPESGGAGQPTGFGRRGLDSSATCPSSSGGGHHARRTGHWERRRLPLRTGATAASPPATHAEGAQQGDQGQVGRRKGGKRGGTV